MKFGVKVMPREVILDTQGRAVEQTLRHHSFELKHCRIGRYIEIDVQETDESKAKEQIRKMTEFVLYNPLIENFEIQRIS